MKKEITLGNLLAIFIPTFIIILTWGNSVETRLKEQSLRVQAVERTNGKVEVKLDDLAEDITKILVELQNKKNRD